MNSSSNVSMTPRHDFSSFANSIGFEQDQLTGASGLAVLVLLFVCRRPILRAARFILLSILTLVIFAAFLSGEFWIYKRFGAVPAGVLAGIAALFVFLCAGKGPGRTGDAASDDEYLDRVEQEESQWRESEHQLREAERIHRNQYG